MVKKWTENHGDGIFEPWMTEVCDRCGKDTKLYKCGHLRLCEDCLYNELTPAVCECCGDRDLLLYGWYGEQWCFDCIKKDSRI